MSTCVVGGGDFNRVPFPPTGTGSGTIFLSESYGCPEGREAGACRHYGHAGGWPGGADGKWLGSELFEFKFAVEICLV